MGDVVQLNHYRDTAVSEPVSLVAESQVPVEFAVGNKDRQACLDCIRQYGVESLQTRRVSSDPEALLYFISIKDAIWLNKRILERQELSDDDITKHIDIIQMLENLDQHMMETLWDSFTWSNRP